MQKSIKRGTLLALAVLFVLTALSGCDLASLFGSSESDIDIIGSWEDPSWGSTLIITADEIDFDYQKAEIVEFSNNSWNGDETDLAEGESGYAVIKFTDVPTYPSRVGKYMIFRWENLKTVDGLVVMDYAEGSDYPTNTYFNTAAEAKAGATTDAGFFSFFTLAAERQ